MKKLLADIKQCTVCAEFLDHQPRPVLRAHPDSKIAIIGQAPGSVVHRTGIPWDDKSGDNLREWLGIDDKTFYDERRVALVPMGFCYPGKGRSGDLPPRKECAPLWHDKVFQKMKDTQLVLLVGKYAQDYYLVDAENTLTATVQNFRTYLPRYFVLPHPSPRNNLWQAKNPWFVKEVLPVLKKNVGEILGQ